MDSVKNLLSFHIIERNCHNQDIITWTYPTISDDNKALILKACTSQDQISFLYLRSNNWIYIYGKDSSKFPDIKRIVVVIVAKDYNPSTYEILTEIFLKKFEKSGDPVDLVKIYLTVFVTGSCSVQENGTITSFNFQNNKLNTNVAELIRIFKLEIILIYTALLLKKRIVVYHDNVKFLQKCLYSITKLMEHRNPDEYLLPYVENVSGELKKKSVFVAAVAKKGLRENSECYDIYVDLSVQEISVSPHSKDAFTMTKTHKDIAVFMVHLSENMELTESQIIFQIAEKTRELLSQLQSLATTVTSENINMITLEDLRARKFNPATENFLLNLAVAENIMML